MSILIGYIALNIAFVFYLIHYLPQLFHNQSKKSLTQISLHFHGLLALCYLCDLSYAFGFAMPWQYCLVSIIGTLCLGIQHWQLAKLYHAKKAYHYYSAILLFLLLIVLYGLINPLNSLFYLLMGYASQFLALSFFIPQIIKNHQFKKVLALSMYYLVFELICYGCDFIAAFTLNWPTPSKIGVIFNLGCIFILLSQCFTNKKGPKMIKTYQQEFNN
jgi:PQ loop repeat